MCHRIMRNMFWLLLLTVFPPASLTAWGQCAPPTYGCARNDTNPIPLPATLPNWGGLTGAGTIFADPSFTVNGSHAPKYVRVTDGNTYLKCNPGGVPNSSYIVTDGSGDEQVFNSDDTLFWVKDQGNGSCFFGLDKSTMNTGFVYAGSESVAVPGAWSQVNPQYYYDMSNQLWLVKFVDTGGNTCHLADPLTCQPTFTLMYDFTANCNLNPNAPYANAGGVGGADTVFGLTFSAGNQNTGHQVVAYNSQTNTCYFYSTRSGQVRRYTGAQTPVTGTVNCNGTHTITANPGLTFDAVNWPGLDVRIGSTGYVINSVASRTSATLYEMCPAGTNHPFSTEPGVLIGRTTSRDLYTIHNVKIDPGGLMMIVVFRGTCYSGICDIVHAWQIGTTNVANCAYSSGALDFGRCGGHWTENANGWANASIFSGVSASPPMQGRTWTNFSTTNSSKVTQFNPNDVTVDPQFDDHPTNKNDPLGTHGYPILSSTYAPNDPNTSMYAYSNEIVGWPQTQLSMFRFGHAFNDAAAGEGFSGQYAIGAASATGQFYEFTTDGMGTLGSTSGGSTCSVSAGTCRTDVFLLNLSPP